MKITIAKSSGFCFGVARAIKMAEQSNSEAGHKVYSLGEIIHNRDENERLWHRGVEIIDSLNGLSSSDTVLIRSHGEAKTTYSKASELGIKVIDTTCPYVKKMHDYIAEYSEKGYDIIIIGNEKHPEIVGAIGWSKVAPTVIPDLSSAMEIDFSGIKSALVLSQTTLKSSVFSEIVNYLDSLINELVVKNTICSATKKRQDAASELAGDVDFMIVIGGRNSSNTKKLYDICKKINENTIHIENNSDLEMQQVKKYDNIGITAGASTPDWVIDAVVEKLLNESED